MSKQLKTVIFSDEECVVEIFAYRNKRKAIQLTVKETGEPMATASVNIPEIEMSEDEVAIKDYAENEGVLMALVAANVISAPVRFLTNGIVRIPICKIIS